MACRCARTGLPTRSEPSRPNTRPWTWNSGSPCTRVSSAVHCQASASASRSAAMARRLITTPWAGRWCRTCTSPSRCRRGRLRIPVPGPGVQAYRHRGQAGRVFGLLPSQAWAPESVSMGAFGDADIGGHRHEQDTGDQAAGDRQHRRRGGVANTATSRARRPARRPGRRTDQVAARRPFRRSGRRRRGRVRRRRQRRDPGGQQHASGATRRADRQYPGPRATHLADRLP